MGQSKSEKKFNQQQQQMALENQKLQNQLITKSLEPTSAEKDLTDKTEKWNSWLAAKDYRAAPEGSILNLDLYTPAKQAELQSRYSNINGIGGLALAQGGNATALQMARDARAAESAERQAGNFENAVYAQDQYFKGNTLPLQQIQAGRLQSGIASTGNAAQIATTNYLNTRRQPILPTLLGATIGGLGSFFTGGFSKL